MKIFIPLLVVVLLWGYLLFTDTRILLDETMVQPGQDYTVEGHGNLKGNSQPSLVCKYFNGRKVLHKVYWYSANNLMGRDSCPFISKQ